MTIERSLTGVGAGLRAMGSVPPRSEPITVFRPAARAAHTKVSPRWALLCGCAALLLAAVGRGALSHLLRPVFEPTVARAQAGGQRAE